ncbi:MAG: hypothetical protein ACO2PP_23965 [Thermocrinis sp.]|uniref:hypothetical protein n=1 Tax=Thermocrinis sp. TaxID=2024383 RepID=UPI003C0465AD
MAKTYLSSPSHTVGSELLDTKTFHNFNAKSPSHTVGSELILEIKEECDCGDCHHPTRWAQNLKRQH